MKLADVGTWSDSQDIHDELDNVQARRSRAWNRLKYLEAVYQEAHDARDKSALYDIERHIITAHNLIHTLQHSERVTKKEIEDGIKTRQD